MRPIRHKLLDNVLIDVLFTDMLKEVVIKARFNVASDHFT